jgi:two-component system sensor histidine kinase VicK
MFKSIRWKFIVIFIMLVLIAIIISGVFIIRFFDEYNIKVVSSRLDALSELMLPDLEVYENLSASGDAAKSVVASQEGLGFREEIFIVSRSRIIASTTDNVGRPAEEVLDFNLLVDGLKRQSQSRIVSVALQNRTLRMMDKVYPIMNAQGLQGLLYLRYDLTDTDETISQSKVIIFQSTLIALGITIVLGFLVTRSITGPINDVTNKAYKMARGDFDQYVEVKSDDEIGKLAEMFNHLTRRLKLSMSDMSKEKNKLEAIVNNMGDGLIAVNKSREILHINPKALELINPNSVDYFSSYDEVERVLPDLLHFEKLTAKYPEWTGSELIHLKDITYRVRFEPFYNEESSKEGLILVFSDVTEHERLEAMRRDFVANVSHELKTPLTSIKSYTETLLDGAADDAEIRQQFLGVIEAEADRMGRLVRDLLQLSNFDAMNFDFEMEEHDWVVLLGNVLNKMDLQIKTKKQDVKLVCETQKIVSQFDYDRMEQVVVNLISNAVKYTPDYGRVRIFLVQSPQDVTLKVMDTGYGIEKAHLTQLFERFYRVDKARSREQGGTGLGLAIAKEIIERHQGRITIDSELGEGTTVTMVIPRSVTVKPV